MVVMWDEPLSEIPVGWAICDGNNGTVDMSGRFPSGVSDEASIGTGGGADSLVLATSQLPAHTHPGSTTDTVGNHKHSFSAYDDYDIGDYENGAGSGGRFSTTKNGAHSHNISSVGSSGSGSSIENRPKYYEIVFIQKL
jgi:microcystin-dependent protein